MIRILVTAALAALALSTAAAAEPLKLRSAYSGVPGHLTALMQHMPKDVITHWSKTYVVEGIFIQATFDVKKYMGMSLAREATNRVRGM